MSARDRRRVLALVALALVTRLPLRTISLEEVDTANFVNALKFGYDIPLLRPHPPGYPVYVFLANAVNAVVGDPLRSLSLMSALLGSLAVAPLYAILLEFTTPRIALFGSLFFIVNPLVWSFSEAGLADVPGMFFVLTLAWLCYRARRSTKALLAGMVVGSLSVGLRQSNVGFLPLLVFPLAYRRMVLKEEIARLAVASAIVFAITTVAWVLPMVVVGSDGLADYERAVEKQWSTAVAVYDLWHVESPWLRNLVVRVARFSCAYLLTFPWTGDDAKSPTTLLLVLPWLFGLALFVIGFRWSDVRHVFLGVWIASILYPILSIHFLARYGLAYVPASLIAALIGYASLGTLLRDRRRLELLAGAGIACTSILYGMKYQPPIGTFEFTPPPGSVLGGVLIAAGAAALLLLRLVWRPDAGRSIPTFEPPALVMSLLVLVFGVKGYALASIAHSEKSPSQQMVEHVAARFDAKRITPCWDNVTHSTFEALIPGVVPTGYWSVQDLYSAYSTGRTLLVTDRCLWLETLKTKVQLSEAARFEGTSPLFGKAPKILLYVSDAAP